MNVPHKLLPFFLLSWTVTLTAQMRWYVDVSATGVQNGMSWEDAFRDLQEALDVAARGDEVWIAEGTYFPTTDNDRGRAFEMWGGIRLYGGFEGWETSPDQRDWQEHPTILSGEIGLPDDKLDNSFNLLRVYESDTATLIDGLLFRDAYMGEGESDCYVEAEGECFCPRINIDHSCGGALYVQTAPAYLGGGLKVQNCHFLENAGVNGAGINLSTFERSGNIDIINTTFESNTNTSF
ncbi:MAG TPA: hypothetical protein ENJ88_08760, partial [Phaeodactylibacter sp.]|nr:hypothetical protein [Phaeodactylibacter sp.]